MRFPDNPVVRETQVKSVVRTSHLDISKSLQFAQEQLHLTQMFFLWPFKFFAWCAKSFFKLVFFTALFLFCAYRLLIIDLPDVDFLKNSEPQFSRYMIHDKNLDSSSSKSINYVPIHKVSPYVIKAILTAEDDRFFEHGGFDWKQIREALLYNIKKKSYAHGASTITQQLARNLFLGKKKSLLRKVRESILTYQLESHLSKKRILELYLNFAEFGPGIYGISAASRYHFQTDAKRVSPSQAALLAAVLPNPKVLGKRPYGSRTFSRQASILMRMNRFGVALPKDFFVLEKTAVRDENTPQKDEPKVVLKPTTPTNPKTGALLSGTGNHAVKEDPPQINDSATTDENEDYQELDEETHEVFVDE